MLFTVKRKRRDTLYAMAVFCVFASMLLLTLTQSGRVYHSTRELSLSKYNEHTCLSYIWSKIKNGDTGGGAGGVNAAVYNGLPAIRIDEEHNGEAYRTYIYFYEGRVYEIFTPAALSLAPGHGFPVVKADAFSAAPAEPAANGLIKISADSGGMFIMPRGGKRLKTKV
jgi:hypothetical protein